MKKAQTDVSIQDQDGNKSKPMLCDVFSFGISTKKDTLTLRKSTYKILPKIKFVRKNEKRILIDKVDISTHKINIPYEIKKVQRSRSWLGNGFQSDDINCYSEWEEEIKVYDKELLSKFIIECFSSNGISFDGRTFKNAQVPQCDKTAVTSSGNYEILSPIENKQSSCPCCNSIEQHLDFETELYSGFGGWQINKNGELYYQAENGDWDNSKTLAEIELEASKDPNNDWQAVLFTPLRGATYQRQNDKWVLVEQNEGFA